MSDRSAPARRGRTIKSVTRLHGRAGHRGFTLVEALLGLVIIGIISAIAIPRINVDAYTVNGSVRGMTTALTYAQRLSVTLQHDVIVAFDIPNNRVRLHEDRNNDGAINGGERVTYTNLSPGVVFGRGTAPATVVGGGTVNFTRTQNGMPAAIFRRDGSASETGGFYIIPARSAARGLSTEARVCELTRATGRVTWSRYNGSAWKRGD